MTPFLEGDWIPRVYTSFHKWIWWMAPYVLLIEVANIIADEMWLTFTYHFSKRTSISILECVDAAIHWVHPEKTTWQWKKNTHLKMYLLLKMMIFQPAILVFKTVISPRTYRHPTYQPHELKIPWPQISHSFRGCITLKSMVVSGSLRW